MYRIIDIFTVSLRNASPSDTSHQMAEGTWLVLDPTETGNKHEEIKQGLSHIIFEDGTEIKVVINAIEIKHSVYALHIEEGCAAYIKSHSKLPFLMKAQIKFD